MSMESLALNRGRLEQEREEGGFRFTCVSFRFSVIFFLWNHIVIWGIFEG